MSATIPNNIAELTKQQRRTLLRGTVNITKPKKDWAATLAGCTTEDQLNAVATEFATKLKHAIFALDNGVHPGDAGVLAPRINNKINKTTRIAERIAARLFPYDFDYPFGVQYTHCSMSQAIVYGQRIVNLSKAYYEFEAKRIEDLRKALLQENEFRATRASNSSHREGGFCTLKDRGPSTNVTHPSAMPVVVPPTDDEFHGLFHFLSQGGKVVGDRNAYVQFVRGVVYGDGRMDCCKQVVGPNHIRRLMQSIKSNEFIRHFLLGNNIINTEGAYAVAEFMRDPLRKANIETWYLAGNALNSEGIEIIAKALVRDQHVRQLWLKRNPIMKEGIRSLADVLLNRLDCPIEVLDLTNTGIGDDGVKFLCEALKENRNLRHLYLDANGLTERSAVYLADYFRHMDHSTNVGITSLWIGVNRLGDVGVRLLMDGLRNYRHLERLVIGSNRMTDVGMDAVAGAIAENEFLRNSLRVLNVGYYKSTADLGELPNDFKRIDHLLRVLVECRNLRQLNATECGLTVDHIMMIRAHHQFFGSELCDLNLNQSGIALGTTPEEGLEQLLEQNCQRRFGCGTKEYRRIHKRIDNGGPSIVLIDSIYRNNM